MALLGAFPAPVAAQSADNVVVVVNSNSADSVKIGERYAEKRGLAADHIFRLKTSVTETVQRLEYEATIDVPVGALLTQKSLQDKVLYIVLTKGIPLRIAGTGGRDGTTASVDSELTTLYRRMVGQTTPVIGRVPNPYYLGARKPGEAKPFTRFDSDIYLVTRLDGFTVDDVMKLIDRGAAPSSDGKILLDQKATLIDRGGDQWLQEAADRLKQTPAADRVILEATKTVGATGETLLGYYSWGSNDPANQLRRFGLTFAPGAIGGMFVSSDARTFVEPPAGWKPSDPSGGRTFAGSFQSLAGDLIRDGITGVAGHVEEPFLDATVRPQILFPAYLAGLNLAEAFYLAMPFVSWQTVIIGDPLCTPFPRKGLTPADIAKDIDPDTELPGLFSARRMAQLGANLNPEAVKLMLKLDAQTARGDNTNTEALLTRATEMDPRFIAAHMALVTYYGNRGDIDKVIERLRRVVEIEPENAAALNDLAWVLADKKQQPKEALPLAERALRKSELPAIFDTVGWIHHLLGEDSAGIAYVERAVAGNQNDPDILLHAAIMHAALNNKPRAKVELAFALKLAPTLAERDDVKALQEKLK